MSDIDPAQSGPGIGATPAKESLLRRALFMILFAAIAQFIVSLFVASCVLQLIVYAVSGRPNDELKEFVRRLLAYLGVLFAYLGFLQDDKPFPFAPFPGPLSGANR